MRKKKNVTETGKIVRPSFIVHETARFPMEGLLLNFI